MCCAKGRAGAIYKIQSSTFIVLVGMNFILYRRVILCILFSKGFAVSVDIAQAAVLGGG
jgi:hypothetical protein